MTASENKREGGGGQRERAEIASESFDAGQEFAGDFFDLQAEEIFDLSTGDDDGDAVGEADDHRTGDEFHGAAEAGDAENDEYDSSHEGAEVQAIEAVFCDDAVHDDYERSGGAADLGGGSAEK